MNTAVYANDAVNIKETTDFGVVVTGVEIIPAGVYIVIVGTITEGVLLTNSIGKRACYGKDFTPSVIGIFNNYITISIKDSDYISLNILLVKIGICAVIETAYTTCFIVVET